MYLKSIEVQGFKSFANRINFEFHNGITCIVGPNGSGKSNVADAVRWVLGEQSAKLLRGTNMQDVIFSGTETRKAQGYAYVAITLDNSDHSLNVDFEEVTVSRRVYRSGESEYKINGASCRLKDVNELFYDTGIGKEGYSVIGQGQIDKILSTKPEDRRELFDEAAGIVKFKHRKEEALKKLESEHQNLVRVQDILSELEKQLGPLEKQFLKAKEYLKLRDMLKQYDVTTYLMEQENGDKQISDLEDKIDIVQRDMNEEKQHAQSLKKQYEENALEETRLSEEYEALQVAYNQTIEKKTSMEGRIGILQERIKNMEREMRHLDDRELQMKQNLFRYDKELDDTQYQQENAKIEFAKLCREHEDLQYQLMQSEAKLQLFSQSVEEKNRRVLKLLGEKSKVVAKVQHFETILEQNKIRKAELSQKLLRSMGEEASQQEKVEDLEKQLTEIEKKEKDLRVERERLLRERERLLEQNRKEEQIVTEKERQYHMLEARQETLKNMAERYDGYGSSIRKIMEQKEQYAGIHGVVADLIQVDKKYEAAIETALGGSIQNIVTDTEQTARKLIEYLKKNKLGRATFLPLDGIRGNNFQRPEVLKEKGIIGTADILVKANALYETVISQLLGRVVVADNLNNALAVARKYNYTLRIVTLDGELLQVGGSITGGTYKNAGNLLGRRRELDELEEQITKQKDELNRIHQKQKQMAQSRKVLEDRIQAGQDVMQQLTLKSSEIRHSKEQMSERIRDIQENRLEAARETGQIDSQIAEMQWQRDMFAEEENDLDTEQNELQSEIKEENRQMQAERNNRENLSKRTSDMQIAISSCKQQQTYREETIQRLKKEMVCLKEEQNQFAISRKESQKEQKNSKSEIESLKQSLIQNQEENKTCQKRLEACKGRQADFAKKQKRFFSLQEQSAERVRALDKEYLVLSSQKEKIDEQLNEQTNYIWNEYGLIPSEARAFRLEDAKNFTAVKQKTEQLKQSIKGLGVVNVNAIEEFKELTERCKFMKSQYEDLVHAEETLKEIILQLEAGMRLQFTEKFKEIQIEFRKVFRELFGGGEASLELIEEEDVIEAGIRIHSQPPGKKLQNMMQLSGGEKALTAIALLFAIQNMKPSPFCLLDEIEAALDDANVSRFADYLHKLTKYTQFIIITHRRGTMNAADRLYGITMQEKGVSALVSVNLVEGIV